MPDHLRLQSVQLPSHEIGSRYFIRLTRRRSRRAVAVVLDLSESCTGVFDVASNLPKLLTKAPRDTPLWLFRMSCREPLNDANVDRVENLLHGSISLATYASDRQLVEVALHSGTLIRPVIEGIDLLQKTFDVPLVTVVVLTDSVLLDRAPVSIPGAMRVIGILNGSVRSDDWCRVVGPKPLFSWNDPKLTYQSVFPNENSSDCLVSICDESLGCIPNGMLEIYVMSASGVVKGPPAISFDSTSTILEFIVQTRFRSKQTLTIDVASKLDSSELRFALADADELNIQDVPIRFLTIERGSLEQVRWDLLLDIQISDRENPNASNWAAFFELMSDSHRKWSDDQESFIELRRILQENSVETEYWNAVMALVQSDGTGSTSRIVLFGLSEIAKPAIALVKGTVTPWGVSLQDVRIQFDRLEARWIIRIDEIETELAPLSSQVLPFELAIDGVGWIAYFSGPIGED